MSILSLKKSLKPLETILLSEIIIVFAMIAGIVPQEFSYLILLLLSVSFIKLNALDSLKLFILSIPFFVALPANTLSDSMNVWRILIVVLFLKAGFEKTGWLHSPERLWSQYAGRCNKFWSALRFHSLEAGTMEPAKKGTMKSANNFHKLFLLTILFLSIALLSLFFAQNIGAGVKKILFLANIFLLFPVVIFAIRKEGDLIEILKAVFCSSGAIVLIGYFQFLATFFIPLYDFWQFWAGNTIKALYGEGLSNLLSYSNTWFSYYKVLPPTLRMFSVMPDSHSFAMLVAISMPVVLSLIFYYEQKKQKKYLSIALIFFLLAIFLSGSRGAWAGSIFAIVAATYLFLSSSGEIKNSSKFEKIRSINLEFAKLLKSKIGFNFNIENNSRYYSRLIAYSVLLFFVLAPVSSLIIKQNQETQIMRSNINLSDIERSKLSMFERAFSISDFSETSNKGRIQIWRETLISIGNHPFLGVGLGNFNYVLGQNESAVKKGSSAHNIYFNVASEIGIFGLMVFLFLLAEIAEYSCRLFHKLKQKHLKIFAGSFFVYFVWIFAYGLFDVVILNDKVLMFMIILIGILYSLDRINCNS